VPCPPISPSPASSRCRRGPRETRCWLRFKRPLEPGLEDGAPIGFVYPKSGTATNSGYVMVSGRAPHPNAGKVFVNWLMSAPGQLVLQEQGGLPVTRPGVTPTKFIPPTSALSNAVDSLTIVSGPEQNKTIDVWRETFGIR